MITNEADVNVNYGNFLLSLAENQSNLLSFDVNNSQLAIIPTDPKSIEQICENDVTAYLINGVDLFGNNFINENLFGELDKQDTGDDGGNIDVSGKPKIISIQIIKPANVINGIDNTNGTNEPFDFMDAALLSKELSEKLPNYQQPIDIEPKEVTILVPEEEMHLLGQGADYASQNNAIFADNGNVQNTQSQKTAHPTMDYPLPETEIQKNIRVFDMIFYNSHKIKLPNPMWGYHKNSVDKDIIIFSKAKWFKSDVLIPPIYEKQVIFHESDDIKIYINNKFSPLEVRRPKDCGELEVILRDVDQVPVCSGGPNITEFDTGPCAQKDYVVGRWRHKLCPVVVSAKETICKFCAEIHEKAKYPKQKKPPFGRRFAKRKES
ncbi:uncharacterized protein LOC106647523 [Copidosoma floridanum]|uniref:uncharacterized protein LOC106647523 n=1 Tax=Copidosoma floridanum TaxID=29053 RepID=UPI0006C9A791|nr:uncharacterized protein LOC106647523 [Copidosoma floridanum]